MLICTKSTSVTEAHKYMTLDHEEAVAMMNKVPIAL